MLAEGEGGVGGEGGGDAGGVAVVAYAGVAAAAGVAALGESCGQGAGEEGEGGRDTHIEDCLIVRERRQRTR